MNVGIFAYHMGLIVLKTSPKLPAAHRPQILRTWLRTKPQPAVDLVAIQHADVPDFADEMRTWWKSLMPAWRVPVIANSDWPLTRNEPGDAGVAKSWSAVRKAGVNGIFLVVLCLFWWRSAIKSATERDAYTSALEDVAWVLRELVKDMLPFAQRGRAPRIVAAVESAPATDERGDEQRESGVSRRGRKSIPSKRKLGMSGVSPTRGVSSSKKRISA